MNRSTHAICLLTAAVVLSACGPLESRSRRDETLTINRNWPAAEVREVRVTEVNGNVSVEPADTDVVTLVATVRGNFEVRDEKENKGLFVTELDGDTLRIGRRDRHSRRRSRSWNIPLIFGRQTRQIDYALRIPASASLQIRTVNGRITTRGIDGPTELRSVNGAIDAETPGRNEFAATTVNGRVRATFSQSFQGARFKTVNGRVNAVLPDDASFSIDLSQVNGDFEATFPVSIRSSPGSRRVSGDVNGGQHELRITTVNGDVQLARLTDTR